MRAPIVHQRALSAPPEVVFAAWTRAESLAVWMCPGELERAEVTLDLKVGGRFRIEMIGPDERFVQHGEFLEIDPPKRLVLHWVSEWMPEGERETRVSLELEASPDGGTRLRLVHDELPASDVYAGHDEGWASILDKFAASLPEAP